ncbi:hypothetical protein NESM_000174400 [Novymonas esmeraldas]|uniref:Uncharacterized protein n=1 Tax=Novymonas esmeraldas TaxID=1808958 RepID=A0AAW0F4K4_9TRYP
MDVSQFLKSFKKQVASKAKTSSGSAAPHAADTAHAGDDDVIDMLRSASDSDGDVEEAMSEDEVAVGGRAGRMAGARYGSRVSQHKRNQDFTALKVLETNGAAGVPDASAFQHQRAAMARQIPASRKQPRAEMVASVRAELLRQREQLRSAQAPVPVAITEAPVQRVEAAMVEVDDLLRTDAPPARIADSVLEFLPALSSAPATAGLLLTPSGVAPVSSAAVDAAQQPPAPPSSTPAVAASESVTASAAAASVPPKKKSKFELAMSVARDADDGV